MKTEQKFYTSIEVDGEKKFLHFSNNFWYLLWKETGEEFHTMFSKFGGNASDQEKFELVLDIIVCAMSAYDYENDIEPNYNKWKLRNAEWAMDGKKTKEIIEIMLLSKGIDLKEITKKEKALKKK